MKAVFSQKIENTELMFGVLNAKTFKILCLDLAKLLIKNLATLETKLLLNPTHTQQSFHIHFFYLSKVLF